MTIITNLIKTFWIVVFQLLWHQYNRQESFIYLMGHRISRFEDAEICIMFISRSSVCCSWSCWSFSSAGRRCTSSTRGICTIQQPSMIWLGRLGFRWCSFSHLSAAAATRSRTASWTGSFDRVSSRWFARPGQLTLIKQCQYFYQNKIFFLL